MVPSKATFQLSKLPGLNNLKDHYWSTADGRVYSSASKKCIKPSRTNTDRYQQYHIPTKNGGKPKSLYRHRLVARIKLKRVLRPDEQVRHLDGNPDNNKPANIAIGTAADNAADRKRHGRTRVKFNAQQVRKTRAFARHIGRSQKERLKGISKAKIGERTGVNSKAIGKIAAGRTHASVPDIPDGAEGIIIPFEKGAVEVTWSPSDAFPGLPSNFQVLRQIFREDPDLWRRMKELRDNLRRDDITQ